MHKASPFKILTIQDIEDKILMPATPEQEISEIKRLRTACSQPGE